MSSWSILWMAFMILFLVSPVSYGWGQICATSLGDGEATSFGLSFSLPGAGPSRAFCCIE